jgi:nitrate/TMAO reductase-like tetraheme cytochrome c subunit
MKRLSLFAALLLSLAMAPVLAAETPAKQSVSAATKAAKAMKPSMGEKGRMHAVHKAEDVACSDCHSKDDVDPLFLRAEESQGREGPVNREGCMDCHKSPKKPTWYLGVRK